MIKNYLKVAWRNITRHKGYSLINIFGLAVGMALFLLIMLFIQFEKSYDRFHRNRSDIYLAVFEEQGAGYVDHRPNTGAPLAPRLLQQFPAIEYAVRLTCFQEQMVSRGEKVFKEDSFVFADDSFFQVFTFPLRSGDARTALQKPFSVILTPGTAKKYFGQEDPLGKVLTYIFQGFKLDFTVTGVLAPIPANSHLQFDFVASYQSLRSMIKEDWFFNNHWDSPTWTYVKLRKGAKADELNRLLPAFCEKFVDKRSYQSVNCQLIPLLDLYLNDEYKYVIGVTGSTSLLRIFLAIAFVILLIACINFTNLATARSELRAREIGMRKVSGATRRQLVTQFLGESLVYSFLALLLAAVLFELFLPVFSSLLGKKLPIHFFSNWQTLITMLLTGLLAGILAGAYPALFLSMLRPHFILKTGSGRGGSGGLIRKILVVGQFTVSIAFIVSVMLLSRQMHFLLNKDLGFNKNHVIVIPIRDRFVLLRYELLKNRLLQDTKILGVSAASMEPGVTSQNGININARGNQDVEMGIIYVDHDFVKTMGIRMREGRDFNRNISGDVTGALLLNEEALKKLGWASGAGEPIEAFFKESGKIEPAFQATVVGVVKDFNFRDLTTRMQELLIKINQGRFAYIMIRFDGKRLAASLAYIRQVWQEFQFNQPFDFTFLDSDIEAVYRSYASFTTIVSYATLLAILIACLGLIGLSAFMAENRSKEIGIRKVFGASVQGIVFMLSKEYLKLVLLANVIAWPAAYFLLSKLLQWFPFHITIGVWTFLLSGVLALAIALITVSYQSIRAALANPVESLRYE